MDASSAGTLEVLSDGQVVALEPTEDPWACDLHCQVVSEGEVVIVVTGTLLELSL